MRAPTLSWLDTILDILKNSKPIQGHTNQFQTILPDGTRVIFRKDFGEYAHPLNTEPFKNKGSIDHYNIEIQIPKQGLRGGNKIIENLHIIPDNNGGFQWFLNDKKVKP